MAVAGACRPAVPANDEVDDDTSTAQGEDGDVGAPPSLQKFAIGGDFEFVDHTGEIFRLADRRGEIFVMFFGYTACPDFCPQTMSLLGRAYEELGAESDKVTTLFISLDPQHDTPDVLAAYLGYCELEAVGLTGTKEAIDRVVPQYAARYEQEASDPDTGPLFAHTTYIYLIDQQGSVRYTFRPDDTPRFIAAGIKKLLTS